MPILGFIVYFGCVIAFIRAVSRDFRRGLCVAVTVFVIMPQTLKIKLLGLADLSIHRLVLLLLLPFLPRLFRECPDWRRTPFLSALLALAGSQVLSLVLSVDVGLSLKHFLSFFCEILLFYVIVSMSIRDRDDVANLIRAACRGLVIVAILAAIEKYSYFDVYAALTGMQKEGIAWGVTATYPHRILLGYAMAMALPLMLVLTDWAAKGRPRLLAWLALIAVVAACYYATSRGPWLAAALAGVGMMVLSGGKFVRKLAIIAGLAAVVCIVRPGVWQTIFGLSNQTFQAGTLKASSYNYRWKLWHVALAEIEKSPARLLFGYGGQSTETMDLSGYFGHEEGGLAITIGFTSWDNNMACDLIEYGIVGFTIQMLIYLYVIRRLLSDWHRAEGALRELMAAIAASILVYVFALSNVYIFAPQLNYLFWILAALGIAASRLWPAPGVNPAAELESAENPPAGGMAATAVNDTTAPGRMLR
jgi:O-antigen ligase